MLTTVACGSRGQAAYALEGAVFIAGAALQWLRDGLRVIERSADVERLAAGVTDTGGVYLVPAFVGLGAPYWDPYARGVIVGLTRGTGLAEIARATIDSMAYQVADLVGAMGGDAGIGLETLRVDGGAAVNDALLQFQADLLGVPVERPTIVETTAWFTGIWTVSATPFRSASTRTSQYSTASSVVRSARVAANVAPARFVATRSRRRSRRSAITPATAARNSVGRPAAAATNPSSPGEFVISRTSQPWAVDCMNPPTVAIIAAIRNRR